jgi:hypothetical protein
MSEEAKKRGSSDDAEVQCWMDRLAIQELIARYADAVTRGDWDQCEGVFTPDALCESRALDMRHEGARAIREFLEDSMSQAEILIQTPHSSVIRILGDESAQATTTIHEFLRMVTVSDGAYGPAGTELNLEQYGVYFDDATRFDGHWKLTRRLFVPVYIGPDRVTGDVLTPRPGLLRPGLLRPD